MRAQERTRVEEHFARRAETFAKIFQLSLDHQQSSLLGLRTLFLHANDISAEDFERNAHDLIDQYPAAVGFAWAPAVANKEDLAWLQPRLAHGAAHFSDWSGRTLTDLPARDVLPLAYCAPNALAQWTGRDFASSKLGSALTSQTKSGNLIYLGLIGFPADGSDNLLDILAAYVAVSADRAPSGSHRTFSGYVLGFFQLDKVVEYVIAQQSAPGLDVLVERPAGVGNGPVFRVIGSDHSAISEASQKAVDDFCAGPHAHFQLNVAGSAWECWLRPSRAWWEMQITTQPWIGLAACLCLTGITAASVRGMLRRRETVRERVRRATVQLVETQRKLETDIAHRVRVEEALKASEDRYRTFISQISEGIWRIELPEPIEISLPPSDQADRIVRSGIVAECNDMMAATFGYPSIHDIVGRPVAALGPARRDHQLRLFTTFVEGAYNLSGYETQLIDERQRTRYFRVHLTGIIAQGRLTRIWGTETDITAQREAENDRKKAEQRLQDAQRLESLGVLAGGIAHDFNNLLTGILGHANLARIELVEDSPLHEHLEQIERASQNAAGLCQQMLAYAGKGRFVVKLYDFSLVVSQSSHLLEAAVSKQAELRFHLAPNLPLVMADATQLQQIVMNLVINASEAIGERSGYIDITTGSVVPSEGFFAGFALAPEKLASRYIFLTVQDTGCGMSKEVQARIFEPFFTTKFSGRGLGLAATLGIVRSHQGALRVSSQVGVGTTFSLYLPAAETAVDEPVTTQSGPPWISEGTALIVDDEASVRAITARMGERIGLRVITAADGGSGLELFAKHQAQITLVLLDLTMPGKSGREVLREMRALQPTIPVLLMSGYNPPVAPELEAANSLTGFLAKPFTLREFRRSVRQILKMPIESNH